METCYEEPTAEDVFTTEEVQTQSQSQQKVSICKVIDHNMTTISKAAKQWPEVLPRKPKLDWLQPRLQVPVSARTQATASRE